MTTLTKATLVCTLLTVGVIFMLTTFLSAQPKDLTLRFHPYIGAKPMVLNSQRYKNPGGQGEFTLRDFQLFISNITLDFQKNSLSEAESYHLLRFDSETTYDQIVIANRAFQHLKLISFGIGIDPKANSTVLFSGDLDPNSRMAWNWQVGYKFLLLEGTLTAQNEQVPLVYHIGFNESYTLLSFEVVPDKVDKDNVIHFKIDLQRLFQKNNAHDVNLTQPQRPQDIEYIDMYKISHVKFSPDDVKSIANGFNHFISIM